MGRITKILLCASTTWLLTGCAGLAQQTAIDELRNDVTLLRESLENAQGDEKIEQALRSLAKREAEAQIQGLNAKIEGVEEQIAQTCTQSPPVIVECEENGAGVIRIEVKNDKIIVGDVEHAWIDPPGISILARMDTGAASSSLSAQEVTEFERDGANWVRFELTVNDTSTILERPVKRYVRVIQQSDREGSRRAVVDMRVFVGDINETFEFTLADRTHLQHAMVLGRNFLTDIALVDVSQQFVQPAYKPETP